MWKDIGACCINNFIPATNSRIKTTVAEKKETKLRGRKKGNYCDLSPLYVPHSLPCSKGNRLNVQMCKALVSNIEINATSHSNIELLHMLFERQHSELEQHT